MQEKKQQQSSHADHVARRAFIKKAAIGAAFAIPAMETFTKSDILVKSALAASGPVWTVTAEVYSGPGNVSPASQKVADGGSAIITVQVTGMMSTWDAYSFDGGMTFIPTTFAEQTNGFLTLTSVHANIDVVVRIAGMM
jgi:hypothetical protein